MSHLKGRSASIIVDAFKNIFRFYLQLGFRIPTVHADGEFGALKDLIQNMPAGPIVNLTSGNEHVPEIEKRIRVVKDRSRAFHHSLLFNWIPKLMTIHAILNITKMLNHFPTKTRNLFGAQSLFYSHRRITGLQEKIDYTSSTVL